jgi:RNA polymerase sigma-70 factor, ECF subfamily
MDEELIERARRGDEEAAGELYARYAGRVYSIVRRIAGDDAQAEDLAHDAWLRALRALPRFRGESRFTTWLHRVAVNAALVGRRSSAARRRRIVPTDRLPDLAGPEPVPLLRMQLERAIDRLPEGMRRVLVLHDVEGYTHAEIAEMLGVTDGASKSQLFRARAKMREQLRSEALRTEGDEACST